MTKSKAQWAEVFAGAKHGHILWDGRAENPYDPALAHSTAHEFVDFAKTLGMFKPGNKILDLGCGNGRFCIPFSGMSVEYTGLDPMREQILFCVDAFKEYPHLKFRHIDVYNECFNPKGSVPIDEYQFPFPDGHLDDVIAYSVFTHLQTVAAARRYMGEIRRVLKPGGRLFVTWYRSPPDPTATHAVGRTVYNEWDIMSMMNGFTYTLTYGGHTGEFYDQWGMFAVKA